MIFLINFFMWIIRKSNWWNTIIREDQVFSPFLKWYSGCVVIRLFLYHSFEIQSIIKLKWSFFYFLFFIVGSRTRMKLGTDKKKKRVTWNGNCTTSSVVLSTVFSLLRIYIYIHTYMDNPWNAPLVMEITIWS